VQSFEYVPFLGCSPPTNPNTTAWVTEPIVSEKSFDGLDKMLLLTWLRNGSEDQPFVLNYFDLRLPNIIIDDDDNFAGIIDWDDVAAVPLQLTAISIAESFFPKGSEVHGLNWIIT
jgi:Phosphotransferase enzyme family